MAEPVRDVDDSLRGATDPPISRSLSASSLELFARPVLFITKRDSENNEALFAGLPFFGLKPATVTSLEGTNE